MSREFQDDNLLLWEAYPSGSRRGFAEKPVVIFNCMSDRALRPRFLEFDGDVADAERDLVTAPDEQMLEWFRAAKDVP